MEGYTLPFLTMSQTRRTTEKFPCKKCMLDCKTDSVLCNCCDNWVHAACVPMSASLLTKWSCENRTFLCHECCHDTNGIFNASDALLRLVFINILQDLFWRDL